MTQGSEQMFDASSGHTVINDTDISSDDVFHALSEQHPEIASLVRWGSEQKRRQGGIFQRDRFMTPDGIYAQFRVAQDAAENDDIVSNVLESTEALAFNKVEMSCEDEQEEDVWNQIIEEIEIDSRLREMWRETFTVSQFYGAVVWGTKTFKVRSKTKSGNRSKKVFENLEVPIGLTILDPLRVVPVGQTLFGQDKLAYWADKDEAAHIDEVLAGTNTSDQVVYQIIKGKYTPTRTEAQLVKEITGKATATTSLYELNLDNVFRHTATKPDYMRFANVRMKSVFELLDIKHNLRQMDRAYLLGATNFIILVKKGSDKLPAQAGEIQDIATQIRGSSIVPIIIGDHRIEIEIITPNIDVTLKAERYDLLDSRIHARLYQMFMPPTSGGAGDDSLKLGRVVSRGLESRRLMIVNSLNEAIFKKTFKKNDQFTDMPSLDFHPQRIALDFDQNVATYLQELRDRGDISRDTILSELDIQQEKEARLRKREKERFDKTFTPTNVPFDGAKPGLPGAGGAGGGAPLSPKAAGRAGGGNTRGGGTNRQSGQSQPGRGTVARPKNAPKPSK